MKFLTITLLLLSSLNVFANESESEQALVQDAIKDTQNKMQDKNARPELLKSKAAKEAHKNTESVVGTENMDEAYAISAEILPEIMKASNNNPEQAAKNLEMYQKNPEAFLKTLSPEAQAKIRKLADKVEKKEKEKTTTKHP